MKPFLRWAGSKRRLLPLLAEYWDPSSDRYMEPFAGSACLFFEVQPRKAILSDTNYELIHTYKVVKKYPQQLATELSRLKKSKSVYYKLRSTNPDKLTETARAARFVYLNRFCFNGLYRTNLSGEFNVPYSPSKTGQLPSVEALANLSKHLERTRLLCEDFESMVRKHCSKGDFVYLDPPYAVENRRIFSQYGPHTFGLNDIDRLEELLQEIDDRGAKFVLSYAYDKALSDRFYYWGQQVATIQRNVSGFSKFRRADEELIISNTH